MKHFYIKNLSAFILLLASSFNIFSQTATTIVYYSGFQACGGCTVCGADYWCINTPGSYCGDTPACDTKTFTDPVPAGHIVTSVTINYWAASCVGAAINGSINGLAFPVAYDGSSGCWCDDLPCMLTSSTTTNYPCGMPGYVYGGTNTLQLCTSDAMCINRAELIFTYVDPDVITPSITASGPLSFCPGGNVTLDAGTGYSAYHWNTGATTQTINVTTAGTYTVSVTSITGCATGSSSVTVSLNPNITVTASASPNTICNGQCSDLSASGASTYTWMPGSLTGSTVNVCPSLTTVYTVTGTSTDGCTGSVTVTITINTNTLITATASPDAVCNSQCTDLTANGGSTYTWMPGNLSGSSVNICPSVTTTYTVNGTNISGCTGNATVTITVNPDPTITISAIPPAVCYGQCSDLTASGADTYTWMPGNLSGTTINICPTVTTVYTVTGTSVFGCSNSETITVGVTPMPVIITNASNDTLCIGQSTELSAGGAYNLQWQPGGLIGAYVNVSPTTTTTYSVIGDINGCIATGSITINVYPYPNIVFSSDKNEGCEDLLVQFTDQSNFDDASFYWEFGDEYISLLQNPLHIYEEPGVYDVSLTLTSVHGCSSSFIWSEMIKVYKLPMAEFITIPESGSELESTIWFFDRSLGVSAWEWYFGDYYSMNNISNEQNPTHVYSDTGLYTVLLIAITDDGCRDTSAHNVYIEPNVTFYVPNAFTPNYDPKNSNFISQGEGIDWSTFEMRIYNRWGHQLLYTKDYENGWNGEYNGSGVSEGVYTWLISFTDIKLKKHNLKGTVTLIK